MTQTVEPSFRKISWLSLWLLTFCQRVPPCRTNRSCAPRQIPILFLVGNFLNMDISSESLGEGMFLRKRLVLGKIDFSLYMLGEISSPPVKTRVSAFWAEEMVNPISVK